MYTIDKNIQIPPKAGHAGTGGRPRLYPFPAMKRGDSFYVNGGKSTSTISAAACGHAVKHGGKFSVRKEGNGVRCWRIK